MSSRASSARFSNPQRLGRTAIWLLLACFQTIAVALALDVPTAMYASFHARAFAFWCIASFLVFGLLVWQERREIYERWSVAQVGHDWIRAIGLNLVLFSCLLVALLTLNDVRPPLSEPVTKVTLQTILMAATVITLLRVDIPLRSLAKILRNYTSEGLVAAFGGAFVLALAKMAQNGWEPLAEATLRFTASILRLYESDVSVDAANYSISVGQFTVIILKTCSGYEGMGLITAVTSIYLWAFRKALHFPNAFLLLPIGIVTAWFFNGLRIAILVSIGAHFSPSLAADGFHSQAGWIAFLILSLGLVGLSQRAAFFSTSRANAPHGGDQDHAIVAYLAPLMALLGSSIVIATASPFDLPIYFVKTFAVALVIYAYREAYRTLSRKISPQSLLAGLLVGGAWILTNPETGGERLRVWLEQLPLYLVIVWLAARVVGSVVVVPIAEELAFRGFLYRWLISRRFDEVSFGHFSWSAIFLSSLCFGLLHERWLAALLAGAVFAFVMLRTQRLSDAVAAHMTANALICIWAVAIQRWDLL